MSPRRLAINAAAMLVLGVLQRGLSLVSLTVISRLLDARSLASYAFTQSTSQTFYGLCRFGLDGGIHVKLANLSVPENRSEMESILGEALTGFLAVSAVGSLAMTLLSDTIAAGLFAAPDFGPFVRIGAMVFASQTMSQFCYVAHAGLHIFGKYTVAAALGSSMTLVAVSAGAYVRGAEGAAWGLAMSSVLTSVLMTARVAIQLHGLGISLRPRMPTALLRSAFSIGLPFYLAGFVLIPVEFGTSALLSRYSGAEALGDLRLTLALTAIVGLLPQALMGPLVSHLSQRNALGADAIASSALQQFKFAWILGLALAMTLAAVWPYLFFVIFGSVADGARTTGHLALIPFVASVLNSVLSSALLASQRSRSLVTATALQGGIIALLAWPLIKTYGLSGLFAAQAIGISVAVVFQFRVVANSPEIRSSASAWVMPLAGLSVCFVVIAGFQAWWSDAVLVRCVASASGLLLTAILVNTVVLSEAERKDLHRAILWISTSTLSRSPFSGLMK